MIAEKIQKIDAMKFISLEYKLAIDVIQSVYFWSLQNVF